MYAACLTLLNGRSSADHVEYSTRNIVYKISMTVINGLAVIAGIIILNGMIARSFGISALGEYLLIRRIASGILPVSLLGITVAIPRYMGISGDNEVRQKQILTAGLALFLRYGLAVILIVTIFLGLSPTLIGSHASFSETVLPLVILCLGLALHQIAYSYFRGKLVIIVANILMLVNVGIIPITLVWILPRLSIGEIILYHGLVACAITGVVLMRPVVGGWLSADSKGSVKLLQRELFSYNVRRIGANLGMLGLSIWTCFRQYQIKGGMIRSMLEVVTLNVFVLICVWLVSTSFVTGRISFLALAGIELFALVLYFLSLYFCRQEWLMFLLEQLKRKSVSA